MISFIQKIGRSIFFKLVLVFALTAVALVIAVGTIVRYVADEQPYRELIGRNLAQYSTYLVQQIAAPPDVAVAERFGEELGIAFDIKTPQSRWTSDPSALNNLPEEEFDVITGFPNVRGARYRGRLFVKVSDPAAEYLLIFGKHGKWRGHDHGEILLLLLFVVGVILGLSYLVVRWLFKPLGWLTDGMKQMGSGQLDTRIPIRKHDELGELTQTFNDMSARIRDLLRAKQQLLLDVSHELRSPMTRMKLSAEFIHDEKVKSQISADLSEMETMTAEILESERLSSEQGGSSIGRVDLNLLLNELVEMYSDSEPGVIKLTDQPLPLELDQERIKILFRNIVDNAVKYSRNQSRPVEIAAEASPSSVTVSVVDYGEGVPEAEQELIFEPFYRVDKSRQKSTGGYGLGLSLCKKIMDAHGGEISVSNPPGCGAQFTILFPRVNRA